MPHPTSIATGYDCVPITPHDTTAIAPCRAFWIGVAGNLVFRSHAGATRTVPVIAGLFPCGGDLVTTASTATSIFAIY